MRSILRFVFAVGALEVAEHDQHHRRAGRAEAGLQVRLDLVQVGFEGFSLTSKTLPRKVFWPSLET